MNLQDHRPLRGRGSNSGERPLFGRQAKFIVVLDLPRSLYPAAIGEWRHTPSSYPESNKCYLQGSRPDLRVPYREVVLSATRHKNHTEDNPPIPIYDTSGPYTDPEIEQRRRR